MKKHIPLDSTIKELEDMVSRVNGLEVSSTDEYQKSIVSVLKTLVQGLSLIHISEPTRPY